MRKRSSALETEEIEKNNGCPTTIDHHGLVHELRGSYAFVLVLLLGQRMHSPSQYPFKDQIQDRVVTHMTVHTR